MYLLESSVSITNVKVDPSAGVAERGGYTFKLVCTLENKGQTLDVEAKLNIGFNLGGLSPGVCNSTTLYNFASSIVNNELVGDFTQEWLADGCTPFSRPDQAEARTRARIWDDHQHQINKCIRVVQDDLWGLFYSQIIDSVKNFSAVLLSGRVTEHAISRYLLTPEFVSWLIRNKKGTVTCSHLCQNPGHRGAQDFSLVQFYVWTPDDDVKIGSISRKYCGIFPSKPRLVAQFMEWAKEKGLGKKIYTPRIPPFGY